MTHLSGILCILEIILIMHVKLKNNTLLGYHADVEPWSRLDFLLDQRWYIDCKLEEAMRRVFRRQTRNGLHPKEARRRIDTNDRPNARQIALCASRADVIVPSLKIRRIRGSVVRSS